jgi:hypothetical protein
MHRPLWLGWNLVVCSWGKRVSPVAARCLGLPMLQQNSQSLPLSWWTCPTYCRLSQLTYLVGELSQWPSAQKKPVKSAYGPGLVDLSPWMISEVLKTETHSPSPTSQLFCLERMGVNEHQSRNFFLFILLPGDVVSRQQFESRSIWLET